MDVVTYALAHSIDSYHFIVVDCKYGSAIVTFVVAAEALLQTSTTAITIRYPCFINDSITGNITFSKGNTNSQLRVSSGMSVDLYVRIVGVCPK